MIYVILAQQTVAERDAIVRKWVEYDARNAGFLEFNFNIISVKSPTHTHTVYTNNGDVPNESI